jgi:hypothetical protein
MLGDSILAEFDAPGAEPVGQPVGQPAAWVAEGVELARGLVYSFDARPHPEHISRLSGDYRARVGLAARRRAALAGYRLAAVLNAALD